MNTQYKKAGSAWNTPSGNSDDSSLPPSDMKHTPPPWKTFGNRITRSGWTVALTACSESHEKQCADAAFIVRAANSHQALVEALENFCDNAILLNLDGSEQIAKARAALASATR